MNERAASPLFTAGQRWLSESELEQGLGLVTQLEGRSVTLMFPATGEIRHYAATDAPLARYQLLADERGQHAEGWYFHVEQPVLDNGVYSYQGTREDTGEAVEVPEAQLAAQVATNHPLTRLLAGKADRLDMYRLRQQAQQLSRRWQQSPVAGLLGARADLLPHQLYIAASVADRYQPRVLLADEVGLGKTIEAGLIMQRRLLTGRSQRILVVVPDSLVHQWLVELQRRFALRFSLFDRERCEQAALDTQSVFSTEQQVVIPQSLLNHPFWSHELLEVSWDLLVVDEVHQLAPSQSEFGFLRQLTEVVPAVLLLTATPEQAGPEAHFARLQLLDPDRFTDFDQFQQEQEGYRQLTPLANALAQAGAHKLLDKLLDQHGTGRVMFRNSRAHVGGFPQRQLKHYPLTDVADALAAKTDWLIDLLKTHRNTKFILICRQTETVLQLAEQLRLKTGIHAAVFHDQLSLLERDRAAAYFASPEDGCPLLICSEIGSEGRNFQFAQHLILFDLPRHPDLLEQRIGRLDRLGQQHDIEIHVPVVEDSVEAVLFAWYESMGAFTRTNAIGSLLYDRFAGDLQPLLDAPAEAEPLLTELAEATEAEAERLRAEVAAGRDRLQELNAFRPRAAAALIETIESLNDKKELASFMQDFWARFGIDFDLLNDDSGWLRPTEHMRVSLPGLPDEGITVTFDRSYALVHEDVEFLSWDHPLVQQALELLTADSYGSTCVAMLQNRALPTGAWFIELGFSSAALAPADLVMQEFYPRQSIRVLLDSQGRDLTDKVKAGALDNQLQFIDKKQSRLILRELRQAAQRAIKQAWPPAESLQQQLLDEARQRIAARLDAEHRRLLELQQRNPMVRDSEIEAILQRKEALLQAAEQPVLQLDSVRIMINLPQ